MLIVSLCFLSGREEAVVQSLQEVEAVTLPLSLKDTQEKVSLKAQVRDGYWTSTHASSQDLSFQLSRGLGLLLKILRNGILTVFCICDFMCE